MRTAWVYAVGLLFMAVSGLAIGRSSRGVGPVGLMPELEPQVSGQGPVVPTGTRQTVPAAI